MYHMTGIILDPKLQTTNMLHPVPHEFDIKEPIKHKTFLINGKIASWKGEYSEVKLSLIHISEPTRPY